jgi:hypothetical protein
MWGLPLIGVKARMGLVRKICLLRVLHKELRCSGAG